MKNTLAFKHLSNIKEREMSISHLSLENKQKVIDTSIYSLSIDPSQDRKEVVNRCAIAILAEQYVSEWMEGYINSGQENLDDEFTYAFDVLANIKYGGVRIEVKTHQTTSKYISVHTMNKPPYIGKNGLNLSHFINLPTADLLIIFNVIIHNNKFLFKPFILTDKSSLLNKNLIKKSNFSGYYINPKINDIIKPLNVHYY